MNDLIKNSITLLIVCILLAAMPTEAEGEIYGDTLRLHILANSDSEEDQALKIRVRDKLLTVYSEALSAAGSAEEAERMAEELLPKIEASVCEWLT